MKDSVYELVMRVTGGNQRAASICAAAVENIEDGDICRQLEAGEAEVLAGVPALVAFAEAGSPVAERPFVVQGGLLYTRRNWQYERNVVEKISAMARNVSTAEVELPDNDFYNSLKPEQRDAVVAMCKSQFSILSGGPGTGKTHTIARAVRFLQESHPGLRLGLAAPTGKAADRMTESMGNAGVESAPAMTIHSMLAPNYDLVTFKHNADNPLPYDWLIVDEASMIGLPLMSKLLDALPEGCKLTLVGDVDQLASVERGRVFGDLCAFPGVSMSRLNLSRRFPPDGEIAQLAKAVNEGRWEDALRQLKGNGELVKYVDLKDVAASSPNGWDGLETRLRERFAELSACRDAATALDHVNDFRILCALREGPYGVNALNQHVKEVLGSNCPVPMMVVQNDRMLGVSNGDVGVVMPEAPNVLHLPGKNGVRSLRVELLPAMECAFATTVHKSQGSEYTDVAIVLPPGGESPLFTKEILYTGITRTKRQVFLYAGDASIRHCCETKVQRLSGINALR